MPNTWWMGGYGTRIISVADWVGGGVTVTAPTTWSPDNGWSVDEATLTTDQMDYLENSYEFLTGQIGPRIGVAPSNVEEVLASAYAYYVRIKEIAENFGADPEVLEGLVEDYLAAHPPSVGANTIGTTHIVNNAITNAKIADDAVGIPELSASGTPTGATVLHGDNVWRVPSVSVDVDGMAELNDDTSPELGGHLNVNGFNVGGATPASLTKLQAINASAAEINILVGVPSTISGLEVSYLNNLTGNIQNQINEIIGNGGLLWHNNDADYERPGIVGQVAWAGSVEPEEAINGDIWYDNSGVEPTITTTTLNPMWINAPVIAQQIVASGTGPIEFTVIGTLPTDITVSSAGVLSGIPTVAGPYSFQVKAENVYGDHTVPFSGTIAGATAPIITTVSLNAMNQGTAFSQQLVATGSGTLAWSVNAGSTLPAGLNISTGGLLSGIPTASGSHTFTIKVDNSVDSDTQAYTINIGVSSPPIITTTTLGTLTAGVTMTPVTIGATGSGTINWAMDSGSLPTGLSRSGNVISGTPTVSGQVYNFVMRAYNGVSPDDTQTFSGTVASSGGAAPTFGTLSAEFTNTMGSPSTFSISPSDGTDVLLAVSTYGGAFSAVTLDGVAMTEIGSMSGDNNAGYEELTLFKLENVSNPGGGPMTISFGHASAGQWACARAFAVIGASTIGTPSFSSGMGTGASLPAVTLSSSQRAIGFFGGGYFIGGQGPINSVSGGTSRTIQNAAANAAVLGIVESATNGATFGAVFGASTAWAGATVIVSA